MAEIMEFLLNLLLLKGKFLKTTAVETLQIALKKCLQYRRKISPMDYDHMISSFENMLEFINYNARQYRCEGENYVVTSDVRYNLHEELSKAGEQERMMNKSEEEISIKEMPERQINQMAVDSIANAKNEATAKNQNFNNTNFSRRERVNDRRKIKHQDYIVDNLHAILKSQEFLFKNIIKLVNFLEKDSMYNIESKKLESIKKKLAACSDVLSNNTNSRNLAEIINNIIEDEITRCRFRHGESKTSAEIDLKAPRPKGIEAALETSRKTKTNHKDEARKKATNEKRKTQVVEVHQRKNQILSEPEATNLRRVKSEPAISLSKREGNIKLENNIDRDNSKKLMEKNEEHFHRFENALWNSLTTLKFMSLKDEYFNVCKCAFHNKRHFVTFESILCKQIKQQEEIESMGKFLAVSETVFQMLENKLVIKESDKPELRTNNQQFPAIAETIPTVEDNPFQELKQLKENVINENIKIYKSQQKLSNHMNEEARNLILTEDISGKFKTSTTAEEKVKLSPIVPSSTEEKIQDKAKSTGDGEKNVTSTSSTTKIVITEQKISIKEEDKIHDKMVDNEKSTEENQPSNMRNQETNTIINGNNLQKCLKISEKSAIKDQKENKQNSSKILPTISENIYVDLECKKDKEELEREKSTDVSHVKSTKSSEDTTVKKCSSEKIPFANETKKEFSQNVSKEESVRKYKAELAFKKGEDVSAAHGLPKIISCTAKNEETIKDILLATIEKEITNFIENGQKSQETPEVKEDRSVTPAFMKKEDVLLPLPIPAIAKRENNAIESKLRLQQIIRNQQEANVILNSQDVRKYRKHVSFPIVKNYENTSLTGGKKIREMSTEVMPKVDNVRNEQEAKVVTSLKKTISCPSIKKLDGKSNSLQNEKTRIHSLSVDKKRQTEKYISSVTDLKEKEAKTANNEITDSGQQIYEKSRETQQLRKIPRFASKKEPSISTTSDLKKILFPSKIKPPSRGRDQDCKRIDCPRGKLTLSPQITVGKEENSMANEEIKIQNKDSLVPNFSEKASVEIVKKKEVNAVPKLKQQQKSEGKRKSETMSLQTVANVDGKVFSIQGQSPQTSKGSRAKSLSLTELKSEADLIDINKKVFDELESTLHTVRIIIKKHPVLMGSNTTVKNRKHKMDEPTNKKFSTKPTIVEKCKKIDDLSQGDSARTTKKNKSDFNKISPTEVKKMEYGKSKTFLKKSTGKETTQMEVKRSKSTIKHPEVVDETKRYPLRRTTKAAMKKQQVFTIFPKVSTSRTRTKPKISSIEADLTRKIKFRNEEVAKHGNFGEERSKSCHKYIFRDSANKIKND